MPFKLIDVQGIVEDEYNLLYVAVTRAKWRLIMSMPLLKALDRVGERFFYPVSTKELQKEDRKSEESSGQDLTVATKAVEASVAEKPVVTIVKRKLYLVSRLLSRYMYFALCFKLSVVSLS